MLGEKNSRTSDNRNDFQYFIKKKKKKQNMFYFISTVKNNEHRPVTFNCSELKNELLALSAPNQTQSSSTMQHKYMHI